MQSNTRSVLIMASLATILSPLAVTQAKPDVTSGLVFSPSPLAFSYLQDVDIALPVKTYSATLTNTSTASVTISSITVSAPFIQTNTCGTSLAAGASCVFTVSATLTTAGVTTGKITVTDTAENSPQVLPLSATGVNPPRFGFSIAANTLAEYTVNASNGLLSYLTEQTVVMDSQHCYNYNGEAISPSGKYIYFPAECSPLYYACNGIDPCGLISGYYINPNGSLSPLAGSPYPIGTAPLEMIITPNGKFAYVIDSAQPSVYIDEMSRSPDGVLAAVGAPLLTDSDPVKVLTDPAGKFLYLLSGCDGVYAYTINQISGALTQVDGSPYDGSCHPYGMSVTPNGKYLVNAADGVLYVYAINSTTGALTGVADSPFGRENVPVLDPVIDPNGRFVYAADFGPVISVFALGAGGALTEVTGSPFATGGAYSEDGLLLDPTGRFLYARTQGGADYVYQVLSINRGTGAVSPIQQNVDSVTSGPLDFFATPNEPPPATAPAQASDAQSAP